MKMYLVNAWINQWEESDRAEYAAQKVIESVDDCYWDDCLDEVYGEVEICGYEYCASRAFRLVDEVAYKCGKNDWLDGQYSEVLDMLEKMEDGDEEDFFNVTIRCKEVYDEEEEEGGE